MNDEEKMNDAIRSAAADYNRPGTVPREEMWTAIQAARSAAPRKLHIVPAAKPVRRFAWIGMAAAAAMLVASGVGIERYTNRAAPVDAASTPVTTIAGAPQRVAAAETEAPNASKNTESSSAGAEAAPGEAAAAPRPGRSREDIRRDPVVRGTGTLMPLPGTRTASGTSFDRGPSGLTASNAGIYQMATARHLADTEALLTSFSVGSRDAGMNAQFSEWARGLLSNTRLLLDSPAGDDPRRAKLLQDLEAVLAQIVQLSPSATGTDRELVNGSIDEGHVMSRLRTAIPAGQPRGILER